MMERCGEQEALIHDGEPGHSSGMGAEKRRQCMEELRMMLMITHLHISFRDLLH